MFLKTCGRLALAALLCGALLPHAWAESEAAPQAGLSLRAALSRTLQSSPELAAYQHVLKAQDGRVTQDVLPLPAARQLTSLFLGRAQDGPLAHSGGRHARAAQDRGGPQGPRGRRADHLRG